jgi:hypothetical protein
MRRDRSTKELTAMKRVPGLSAVLLALVVSPLGLSVFARAVQMTGETVAQVPALPPGARTHWIVSQPQEIVAYVTFDPAGVHSRLPPTLRFITVGELASAGVRWAADHLVTHPAHDKWGISFLEIVRTGTFSIDGRAPRWPKDGAAGFWCARVAASDPAANLGPGQPFLVLDLWIPDSEYVAYMRARGHHATYGEVGLFQDPDGRWHGSVRTEGLTLAAQCAPIGPIVGGAGAAGMQVFFPPMSSSVASIVRVAFAGHRVQECRSDESWNIRGTHPLAGSTVLGPSNYEFGYDMAGGAYPVKSPEDSLPR